MNTAVAYLERGRGSSGNLELLHAFVPRAGRTVHENVAASFQLVLAWPTSVSGSSCRWSSRRMRSGDEATVLKNMAD